VSTSAAVRTHGSHPYAIFLQPFGKDRGNSERLNLHAYVGADPVNWTDPLGLAPGDCAGGSCEPFVVMGPRTGSGGAARVRSSSGGKFKPRMPTGHNRDGGDPFVGPPLPPDACNAPLPDGSTVNKNVDKIKDMIKLLSNPQLAADGKYAGPMPTVTAYWLNLVRERGAWDYKLQAGGSQRLGNLNYGATGVLLLPLDVLLRGAGAVQDPNTRGPGHWTDRAPSGYGDQTADISVIKQGAIQCKGTG
jgi:hypothetical protein